MSISILMFIAGLLFIAASMLDLGWNSVRTNWNFGDHLFNTVMLIGGICLIYFSR